jgi:hypothetical protein
MWFYLQVVSGPRWVKSAQCLLSILLGGDGAAAVTESDSAGLFYLVHIEHWGTAYISRKSCRPMWLYLQVVSERTKMSKQCTVPTLHSPWWRWRHRHRRIWLRWTFLSGAYWTLVDSLNLTKISWTYMLPSLGIGWHQMRYKCTSPATRSAAAWGRSLPRAAFALNAFQT